MFLTVLHSFRLQDSSNDVSNNMTHYKVLFMIHRMIQPPQLILLVAVTFLPSRKKIQHDQ